MGAVNTTYTFTATDTITSTKMNNIIDQTTITDEAIIGTTLEVASGKLKVRAQGITSNEMATGSVTSNAILDGTIVNADINASAEIAGTKISPNFGSQNISNTGGNLSISNTGSCVAQTTSGTVTGQLYSSSANSSVAVGSVSNNPLVVFTNNTERMRITAAGNVGIGTNNPSAPLEVKGGGSIDANPDVRVSGSSGYIDIHNSLSAGGYNGITSSGDKAFIFSDGTVNTGNLVIAPWTNNTSGIRINSSGNVGICKSSPTTALDVNGTVTATAFAGPLTGNVTGNASTATTASSCTGNSATVTNGVYTNASNILTGSLSFNNNGTNTISNGTGDNATLSTYNLAIKSWWGIGFPSNDNVNRIVFDTRSGGAQFSGTVTAPTFSGNATTASTATTVSNGAITAAKLNGAQGGSAPIYGIRAAVNFEGRATNGNCTIRSSNNVSSVSRVAQGKYVVYFAQPMQGTGYTVVASAGTSPGSPRFACADRSTAAQGSIKIETDNASGAAADFNENNVMIIE